MQVLYNPVNMDNLRPDPRRGREMRTLLGLPEDAIMVGYSGSLQVGKGIFPLLEAVSAAMASEPALHCLWLGDGPDAARLHAQAGAQASAGRHRFVGWINDATP